MQNSETPQQLTQTQSSEKSASEGIKLGDLMDKDPLLLKDEEVDKIVSYLTETYKNWQAEEAKAQGEERRPKPSKGTSAKKASSVNLDDLGL